MKVLTKIINYSLTIFFIAAAIGLAYVAIPAFGNKALIVRSGSMQPTINVGDLIVVNAKTPLFTPQSVKISKYKKGDIVAFSSEKNAKVLTTHRIVGAELKDNKIYYKTKGDANSSPDQNLVAEEKILGKSTFVLPSIGKLFAFAKNKNGFILMVVLPAMLVIVHELVNIVREVKKLKIGSRIESSPLRSNYNLPVFRVLFPFVLGIMFFHNSFAYFSDPETSTENVFQASQIFTNHLVISEVQIDGGIGQANDNDFIELYNPTSSPFNLNGHRLVKRTGNAPNDTNIFTFTSSHIVPAHGYFLWANDDFTTIATTPDVTSSDTLGASNSVAIRQGDLDTGTIIDALSWDPGASSLKEGTQFPSNPGANQSLERKALSTSTQATMEGGADASKGNGFDLNDNATDFILRTSSQPQNTGSSTESP